MTNRGVQEEMPKVCLPKVRFELLVFKLVFCELKNPLYLQKVPDFHSKTIYVLQQRCNCLMCVCVCVCVYIYIYNYYFIILNFKKNLLTIYSLFVVRKKM